MKKWYLFLCIISLPLFPAERSLKRPRSPVLEEKNKKSAVISPRAQLIGKLVQESRDWCHKHKQTFLYASDRAFIEINVNAIFAYEEDPSKQETYDQFYNIVWCSSHDRFSGILKLAIEKRMVQKSSLMYNPSYFLWHGAYPYRAIQNMALLFSVGADPNSLIAQYGSPYSIKHVPASVGAIHAGELALLKVLLQHGVTKDDSVRVRNLLYVALRSYNKFPYAILNTLLFYGADPYKKMYGDKTVIDEFEQQKYENPTSIKSQRFYELIKAASARRFFRMAQYVRFCITRRFEKMGRSFALPLDIIHHIIECHYGALKPVDRALMHTWIGEEKMNNNFFLKEKRCEKALT